MATAMKSKGKKAAAAEAPKKKTSGLPDSISKLVTMLRDSGDDGEKRRIRAKLRSLGHTGGLGVKAAKKKDEKGGKKGGKKKAAKKDEDEDEEEADEEEDEATDDDEEAEDEDEDADADEDEDD
jgi:hypothetical protein